jgi:hypothetical protein
MNIFYSSSNATSSFNAQTQSMLSSWRKLAKDSPDNGKTITVDMNKYIPGLSMSIICETGFSYKYSEADAFISDDMNSLLDEMNIRMSDPIDGWHNLFPNRVRTVQRCKESLENLMKRFIDERVSARAALASTGKYTKSHKPREEGTSSDSLSIMDDNEKSFQIRSSSTEDESLPKDLLDILLDANDESVSCHLSYEDLRDHIVTCNNCNYCCF